MKSAAGKTEIIWGNARAARGDVVADDEITRRLYAKFQAEMRALFPRLREMTRLEGD